MGRESFPKKSERKQSQELEPEQESVPVEEVDSVITEMGSIYTYLPDGRTQRFKTAEQKWQEPQSLLVYIPDYKWVKANAPKKILERFSNDYEWAAIEYQNTLVKHIRGSGEGRRAFVVIQGDDGARKIAYKNEEVRQAPEAYLYLQNKNTKEIDLTVPVSPNPRLGFYTYDTREYTDPETGIEMEERHMGNRVVEIRKKDGTVVKEEPPPEKG